MNECVIKIENLYKEYKMFNSKKARLLETVLPHYENHGTFCAMDNLSLEVYEGEILGVLGKNGAGKSTLLKMITGVVAPTSGTIEINGKISSLLELGTAFNPELTGRENIYQHGQVMGMTNSEIKAKEQEIIDFADIGNHLDQPVKTYSSGMFARLAFACAINVEPDILIVDEVLSVGDMAFQLKCFKKFEQFKNKNKTIIFVTHSIGDVLRNCTRGIIIDAGVKIYEGETKDAVERYKKLIAGLPIEDEKEKEVIASSMVIGEFWKDKMNANPDVIDYGNKEAEVIDYGIFDKQGNPVSIFSNDQEVTMKSKIFFNQDVKDPIFTMTIKDFKGLEMCGTNTLVERKITGEFLQGETCVCSFKLKLPVSPGRYTVSFSCTHFNETGDLEVFNRKYDALLLEILSSKDCVGLMRLDCDIDIVKL